MAFFKFRKGGEDAPAAPTAAESVQAMRTRARHRLIGASVLVLAGVIGFPLLFDNQPRPIAVDIPIEIPDKNKVKPLGSQPISAASTQSGGVIDEAAPPPLANAAPTAPEMAAKPAPAAVAKVAPKEEVIAPSKVAPAPAAKPEPKPDTKLVEAKPEAKPDAKPAAAADAAKALALLEGKSPAKAEAKLEPKPAVAAPATPEQKADVGKGRFVVQVGSFTDMAKAREARLKMEKAGFKTYTQEVQLKEGKRLRVRIGPFETRALAEKAAEKAKKLELSGAILEL